MINIKELQPSTVEVLKHIYTEHREIVLYMQKSGTAFEKAVALIILSAGGDEDAL